MCEAEVSNEIEYEASVCARSDFIAVKSKIKDIEVSYAQFSQIR